MIRCQKDELQLLSGLRTVRGRLTPEQLSHALSLICRRAITASEQGKDCVAVFDEGGGETSGARDNSWWDDAACPWIEQYRREWTRSLWHPEQSAEAERAIGNHYCVASDGT